MRRRTSRSQLPLVSCLCITKNAIEILSRAIECFNKQSYVNKELVLVCKGESANIEKWFRRRHSRNVKLVQVIDEKVSLGELRNIAIEHCSGDYFCQWDDDDWFHRDRIKVQIQHILQYRQPACILNYLIIFDDHQKQAFLSRRRIWEGSLMCKRSVFPKLKFQPWPRHEDANFIYQLLRQYKIIPVLVPGLYVYVCHGANTSGKDYFHKLFAESQKLSRKTSRLIHQILLGKYSYVDACSRIQSPSVFEEMDFLHGYLASIRPRQ